MVNTFIHFVTIFDVLFFIGNLGLPVGKKLGMFQDYFRFVIGR